MSYKNTNARDFKYEGILELSQIFAKSFWKQEPIVSPDNWSSSSNPDSSDPISTEVNHCVSEVAYRRASLKNDTLDKLFTKEELRKISKKLKNNKASDLNAISNKIIKCCMDVHGALFVKIFNSVFQSGCFPQGYNDGFITPVFNDPNNYCGVSILWRNDSMTECQNNT